MYDKLRLKYKNLRADFCGEIRAKADNEIKRIFLEEYSSFNSFFIYNSFGSEADTSSIVAALLAKNKQIYLPKIIDKVMYAAPYSKTQKGTFGIEEPISQPYYGKIDVCVAPLLAVNEHGYRLGYGGGYYDKFLKDKNILKVGLGYSFQICSDFENREWDEQLNAFVCEKGVIKFF
ncbi:MAG: 5-formyltetrahydrofolate cyclo-ligase [Clostridia bacterium]|nr:5-formyltetrahydrofolate cyclo-ligase [Clostridia bacterium]